MSKWADYLISAVHYTDVNDKRFISKVEVREDLGDKVGIPSVETKDKVVKNILDKVTYITIVKNEQNNWAKGEDVRAIKHGDYYYLRSDPNYTAEDNLGNLPEF